MKTGLIITAGISVIGLVAYYFYAEFIKRETISRAAIEKKEQEAEAEKAARAREEEHAIAIAEAKAERAREKQRAYRKRKKLKKAEEAKKITGELHPVKQVRKPKTSK